MRLPVAALLALILFSPSTFAAVSVGTSDGNGICDYTTVAAALASGDSEIRLVNNFFKENITINHAVTMTGGFSNCNHANAGAPDPSGETYLDGTANPGYSVIKVNLADTLVILKNFFIYSASYDASVPNGGHGILVDGGRGSLTVIESYIYNNEAAHGGGIHVTSAIGQEKNVNLIDSQVFNNDATGGAGGMGLGGGIYCAGEGGRVAVTGPQGMVAGNEAYRGGGIYASNGCTVWLTSGFSNMASSSSRGVMNNKASNHGGGVYLLNESKLFMNPTVSGLPLNVIIGDNDRPATLAKNSAGGDGGGVYADQSSRIDITDSLIHGNSAAGNGGGIYAQVGSQVTVRPSGYECWSEQACNRFSENTANQGGAVNLYLTDALKDFQFTDFIGNRANQGTVMYVTAPVSPTEPVSVFASTMYHNGNAGTGDWSDFDMFVLESGTSLWATHVTVADNSVAANRNVFWSNNSQVTLRHSIFQHSETILRETGSASNSHQCLVVSDDTGLIAGDTYVTATPGFVDPAGDNFDLKPDSIAVDLCAHLIGGDDKDGDPRGLDIKVKPNVAGTTDAGADEYNDFDLVFKDGYEDEA